MASGQPNRSFSPTKNNIGRSKSVDITVGTPWSNIRGIMKIATIDESLHSVYGSESSQASQQGKKKKMVHIQFEKIEIREYARTVGDNPSVSSGPPVTISWEYNPNTTVLSLEEYEKARPVRRTETQMILPKSVRVSLLKDCGISNNQIVAAIRSGVRAKNQRRTTLGNLGRTEKVEEIIEGAAKQLLKTLFLRKSTSAKAQELQDEIQKVNNHRAQIVLEYTSKEDCDESDSSCPWATDLEPDESENELAASSQDTLLRPGQRHENLKSKSSEDRFRPCHNNEDKIRKPRRLDPSDPNIYLLSLIDSVGRGLQSTEKLESYTPDAQRRAQSPVGKADGHGTSSSNVDC